MSNPSPILTVSGRAHAVVAREVAPVAARPEERDPETGRLVREAQPAREGYSVQDVTVLTDQGGFATVSLLPQALMALGGSIPTPGEDVSFPVRPYIKWAGRAPRKYPTVGLSVAADALPAAKPLRAASNS